jgi:O-antigen/teichoic acid export membrane protein
MLDGTIRVFFAEALFPLTGLLTAAFLTRNLGPADYGLLTLAATLVALVEGSIDSLLSRATIKWVGQENNWKPVGTTVIRIYLFAGCAAALGLWLSAQWVATLLQEPMLANYLGLFALDVPLHSLAQGHRNLLVGIGAFRPRAFVSACRWVARLLLIVTLVALGLSVSGAILGSIGASLVELIIARSYIQPALFQPSTFRARKLWGDAIPLFLFAMSWALYHRLDLFLLKLSGGTSVQAGVYGAAQNLSVLPGVFAISFSPLLLATLSRIMGNGDVALAKEISTDAMRLIVGLLPFAGLTAGMAHEIVDFIFGPPFLQAAPLLALLIFGAAAMLMISVATAILTAAGKPKWPIALTLPFLPLAAGGHLLLIPRFGAVGAAAVTSVLAMSAALILVMAVHRLWKVVPPLTTVARSLLLCGLAFVLSSFWPAAGAMLFLKFSALAILILGLFALLGEFTAGEIALARSAFDWRAAPGRNPG